MVSMETRESLKPVSTKDPPNVDLILPRYL